MPPLGLVDLVSDTVADLVAEGEAVSEGVSPHGVRTGVGRVNAPGAAEGGDRADGRERSVTQGARHRALHLAKSPDAARGAHQSRRGRSPLCIVGRQRRCH